jgi:hypothetical protein
MEMQGMLIGISQVDYDRSGWWRDMLFELNSYASSRPAIGLYVIILLAYIMVVLPGLFLILKKKDKMHYLRELLTAVALLFSALIFVLGARTRLTAPAFNYVRVLEYESDVTIDDIYISVQIPYRQEIAVDVDGIYALTPLNVENIGETQGPDFDADYRYQLNRDENGTQLVLKDSTAVTPMYFLMTADREQEDAGIYGQLSVKEGLMQGTLFNATGLDFKECMVIFGDQRAQLGPCAEQLTVSDTALTAESTGSNTLLDTFVDSLKQTDTPLFVGICEDEDADFIRSGDNWDLSGVTIVVAPVMERNGG